jgi:hypothetical protein
MTQPNIYVLEGGASNQIQRIKGQNFFRNQTSISYVNSSIKLNVNQSANVNLKPRKRCVFLIFVILFQSSDTFHKEFVPS